MIFGENPALKSQKNGLKMLKISKMGEKCRFSEVWPRFGPLVQRTERGKGRTERGQGTERREERPRGEEEGPRGETRSSRVSAREASLLSFDY